MPVNAQYNVAKPGSFFIRVATYQRVKMYKLFISVGISPDDTILDVGTTSHMLYEHSNYLEAWYPHKSKITALGVDQGAAVLTRAFPGVRFVMGDGRRLPFRDGSFDYVHSSAVLEHVGDRTGQINFIAEAKRVARRGVFLTTPNRWYPIEFHTMLPIIHWLPPKLFRQMLVMLGKAFFADERNLNLMSASDLRVMADGIGLGDDCRVYGVRLAGLVTNLIFVLFKKSDNGGLAGKQQRQFLSHPLAVTPFAEVPTSHD